MAFLDKCIQIKLKMKRKCYRLQIVASYRIIHMYTMNTKTNGNFACKTIWQVDYINFSTSIIIKHWFLHLVQFIFEQFSKVCINAQHFVVTVCIWYLYRDIVQPSCSQCATFNPMHCVFLSNEYCSIFSPFLPLLFPLWPISFILHSFIHSFGSLLLSSADSRFPMPTR